MQTDDVLQVMPAAAESANTLTGSAAVEFPAAVVEQAAHGAAVAAVGGAHVASMWAPSVAASAGWTSKWAAPAQRWDRVVARLLSATIDR